MFAGKKNTPTLAPILTLKTFTPWFDTGLTELPTVVISSFAQESCCEMYIYFAGPFLCKNISRDTIFRILVLCEIIMIYYVTMA